MALVQQWPSLLKVAHRRSSLCKRLEVSLNILNTELNDRAGLKPQTSFSEAPNVLMCLVPPTRSLRAITRLLMPTDRLAIVVVVLPVRLLTRLPAVVTLTGRPGWQVNLLKIDVRFKAAPKSKLHTWTLLVQW